MNTHTHTHTHSFINIKINREGHCLSLLHSSCARFLCASALAMAIQRFFPCYLVSFVSFLFLVFSICGLVLAFFFPDICIYVKRPCILSTYRIIHVVVHTHVLYIRVCVYNIRVYILYMCKHMHIIIYLYEICICKYTHRYIYNIDMHIHMYNHTCLNIYTYPIYTQSHIYIYTYISYMYTHTCLYMCIYLIPTQSHTHIYLSIYLIYLYICIHTSAQYICICLSMHFDEAHFKPLNFIHLHSCIRTKVN